MNIWPESAGMTEFGEAAPAPPAAPTAAGAAAPTSPGAAGQPGAMAAAVSSGEIALNRAEVAALAALETEADETKAVARASEESGLSREQIQKLQARAKTALSKGFTLKGQGFIKKPSATAPDEPGLTRDKVKGEAKDAKAKETNASLMRTARRDFYTVPDHLDYGFPMPQSDGNADTDSDTAKEANSRSTMAAMLNRRMKAKKRAS